MTLRRVAGVLAMLACAVSHAAAQAPWTAPRTPDGQPDLQGVWVNASVTPLERPADLGDRAFFSSEKEADAWAQKALTRLIAEGDEAFAAPGTVVPTLRTSLIVDPADGRIPYTEAGRARWAAVPTVTRDNAASGPEDRPLGERCIAWGEGPPLLPRRNNPYLQIVQSAGHAVILTEMIHHARIVPLDGRPPLSSGIRQWIGDSRGRWEGDTLVVETSNFTDKTAFRGSTDALRVTERFTRVSDGTMRYRFTIEDPAAFTAPWSGETFFARSDERLFEYACHEGNRSMSLILRGAREEERQAAARRARWLTAAGTAATVGVLAFTFVRRRRKPLHPMYQ